MKLIHLKPVLGSILCACALLTGSAHAENYHVTVDTSTLLGTGNGPFYLDFQMNYGSGTIGNSATISNFSYGGGSVSGSPIVYSGNPTGSIASSVSLADSAAHPFNELYQGFTPGGTLSFDISVSNNGVGATPDALEFAILDNQTFQIPTTQPTGSNDPQNGIDGLSLVDITIGGDGLGSYQQVYAHAYNGANNPSLGGDYTGVIVTVASVPEPSSWALAGLCAGLFAFLRRRVARS